MGRAWGGREPRNSEAAQSIIAAVKKLATNEKLAVISLGALTNIASAIALDTSIARRIICYVLGARYNNATGAWNKSEFNIRNDLNAFDYLLDNTAVDVVIMPIDVALPYRFQRDSLYTKLRNDVPLEKMLKQRWEETNPQDTVRTLWDLALAEAFINPGDAIINTVQTPPENTKRMIRVYSQINVRKLKDDFYAGIKAAK
jgi:inosine-uridine nucleoside N-ribohydrolase